MRALSMKSGTLVDPLVPHAPIGQPGLLSHRESFKNKSIMRAMAYPEFSTAC
jgi:hypothetical protein